MGPLGGGGGHFDAHAHIDDDTGVGGVGVHQQDVLQAHVTVRQAQALGEERRRGKGTQSVSFTS